MPFADPEEQRAYDRQKYLKNREKIIARSQKRHVEHREERLVEMKANYYDNREECSARIAMLTKSAINRAKREDLPYESRIVWFLSGRTHSHCPVCEKKLDYRLGRGTGPDARKDSPSVDRIIPVLGYVVSNVRIICTECNGRKWTSLDPKWLPADYEHELLEEAA